MKKFIATTIFTLAAGFANAAEIYIDGVWYDTEAYSENSIGDNNIYTCTPTHVEKGECSAVDQKYYDALALAQFGPWTIMKVDATNDTTNEDVNFLVLQGGISEGISTKLDEALTQNPNVDTVLLHSKGGNPDEAVEIFKVFQKHQVNTWVPEGKYCMSACAVAFLGGVEKNITGVVGFHSAWYNYVLGMPTDYNELLDYITPKIQLHTTQFGAIYQAAGLSGEFGMDVAKAGKEFLNFTSSAQMAEYDDNFSFDAVDHTKFMRSVEDAQNDGVGDIMPELSVNNVEVVFAVGK